LDNQPTAFRIETDSMGEVKLPIGALYGAQTQRAVDNFTISGLRPWRAFIWSIGVIKQAAAQVNCELALLDKATADSIIQAASEVAAGKWDDQFVVDVFQAGAGTSHNMNANEVIANRATQILGGQAGEYRVHPNDHVNMSQSTNDVIPAAIRLGCLWRLDELLNSVHDLAAALQAKAVEFDGILKSGRTHLQDAVPIRLGQEFGAYGKAVGMDEERIKRAGDNLRRLGIGGTAVGTGLNAHPQFHPRMVNRLSELTGMALFSSENLFESMQSMADMADFSASLRTLALTLIRIANDLRLLASGPATGLDEIRLPALQPGSSIMPGKINPVIPEMLNMAMYYIIGCDTSVAMASQAGQLELNVMMPVIAHTLFGMMHVMIGAVHAFTRRCVTGISANPQKAAYWLSLNSTLITALNPLIGYRAGAELVKEAALRNLPIRQVAVEKARQGLLLNLLDGKPISVDEIEGVFQDLRRFTEGGIIPGN
jgi:fumarate hydratase class II